MNIRTEITVKIEPFLIISQKAKTLCPLCESEMISPNQAARLIGCNPSAIFGWFQLGWLHFKQTPDDLSQVCRKSLREIININ